jgi:hypothetical protein
MLAMTIFIVGLAARFIEHTPNFTPILALALFGGAHLPRRQALWLPIVIMGITDLALGWHPVVPFTWGSLLLITILGYAGREKMNWKRVTGSALVSGLVFFVVSNLGVWMFYYPKTLAGLVECYALAIPFFRSTLGSCLVYSWAFFGIYELAARGLRHTRWAHVV